MSSLAVVVPILNEIGRLESLIKELDHVGAEQVIIVDGGSTDGSIEWLKEHWINDMHTKYLLTGSSGRAVQMNAGATQASADVLLFLHADTVLPDNAKSKMCCSSSINDKNHHWGRFNVAFDESCAVMRVIAFFINCRSRLTGVATGDQAMFVSRSFFNDVGGFDNIALMEDVALSKKLRKFSMPKALNSTVVTSARRWKQNGVARTVIKMWWYRFAYFVGVSPEYLAGGYRNVR